MPRKLVFYLSSITSNLQRRCNPVKHPHQKLEFKTNTRSMRVFSKAWEQWWCGNKIALSMEQNEVTRTGQHDVGFSRKSKIWSKAPRGRRREQVCLHDEGQRITKITSVHGKSEQGRFHILEASDGTTESTQFRLQSSSWTNFWPEQRKTKGRRLGTSFLKFT